MNETNITNQNEVMDEFDLELQRSAERHTGGQKANGRGKHLGLLLMRATGAESAKGRSDNLAAINGVPVRFHSADGKHFSLNPKTEAPSLIFATYKGKPTADKPLHCRIYGLRLAECLKAGKRAKSGSTERVSVSLALVGKRIRLGNAFFPSKFIEADSPDHWMDLEDAIAKLTGAELETEHSCSPGARSRRRQWVRSRHRRSRRWRRPLNRRPPNRRWCRPRSRYLRRRSSRVTEARRRTRAQCKHCWQSAASMGDDWDSVGWSTIHASGRH